MIVGPFSGEVGYELLYWIPYLRWRLGTDFENALAITRGGGGLWYPCETIDAYDHIEIEKYRHYLKLRQHVFAQKSFGPKDPLDAAILKYVGNDVPLPYGAPDIHPHEAMAELYKCKSWPIRPLPKVERWPDLPEKYVAVRCYLRATLPESAVEAVQSLIDHYSQQNEVVLVSVLSSVDEHEDMALRAKHIVHTDLRNSLSTLSRVVAHADEYVATYGGPSYLGPLYGVPTLALMTYRPTQHHHEMENRLSGELGVTYNRMNIPLLRAA